MRYRIPKIGRNAIALLKLMLRGEEDILTGRVAGQDVVFARVEARLAAKSPKKS